MTETNREKVESLTKSIDELKNILKDNTKLSEYSTALSTLSKTQFEITQGKTESLLNKIFVLKSVMTAAVGSSFMSEGGTPVFKDDELFEYKDKMLELIKEL